MNQTKNHFPQPVIQHAYTAKELASRAEDIKWTISSDGILSIWLDGAGCYVPVSDTPMHRALATWVARHPDYKMILERAPRPPVGNIELAREPRLYSAR